MKARILALDGLRGVSAFAVLLFHVGYYAAPGTIFTHGYLAVDVFFVMSGVVIAASYEDRLLSGLDARRFIGIRIRRLAPAYWAGTVIGFVCTVAPAAWGGVPLDATAVSIAIAWLLLALFLLPYGAFGRPAFPLNGPGWSLFLEMIVNYLYARWIKYLTSVALCCVAVAGFAASTCVEVWQGRGWSFGWDMPGIFLAVFRAAPSFAIGILIYRKWRNGGLNFLPSLSPSVLIIGWFVLLAYPSANTLIWDTVIAVLISPLLVALLTVTRRSSPRWFVAAGSLSYPLYASHFSMVRFAYHLPFVTADLKNSLLYGAGIVAVALMVAWAIHQWMEGIIFPGQTPLFEKRAVGQ
jgi:peptidoglycan/LPS O-acetylase OafA/YrhL